jgi:signal transduction histidine kinase
MDSKILSKRNEEDPIKKSFMMYKKVLEDHPEITEAIKENKLLKQLNKMFGYELKTQLNGIIKLSNTIRSNLCNSDEEKNQAYNRIKGLSNIMGNLIEVLSLEEFTEREFKSKSSIITLEEIAREHADIQEKYMEKEKIGLHLKYNKMSYNKPIEIYANRAIMNTAWGALFRNSLAWTPPLSNITQVFRINKMNNLEIIMENAYANERVRGNKEKKEGMGIPFVKNIVNVMNGNFQTYKTISQIQKDYDMQEWHGYKKSKNPEENQDIFGIKITIPMKELTKKE